MDSCHSEQLETMPDLRDCSAPPLSILIYWLLTGLTMTSLKKVLLVDIARSTSGLLCSVCQCASLITRILPLRPSAIISSYTDNSCNVLVIPVQTVGVSACSVVHN